MNVESARPSSEDFDIAVIGLSGRFPGARNVTQFWDNLASGLESITFFSDKELLESGIDPDVLNHPNYVKASPILDDPDLFDASFFSCSPKEARAMDPQHRFSLECAWEAMEHAGYDTDQYDGSIGIYAGAAMNTYLLFSGLLPKMVSEYLPTLIGGDKDFLTTRVSYKMNLRGPSVAIQTACSTSLVAVHLACQSLLNEECDIAMAGGVSLKVPHKAGYFYEEGSVFTPDGHCKPFDAGAQGTIFGSGVGIVVLKRLGDAVNDGDTIHAVIKGSAVNNDGSSKVDYTAPSVDSQAQAIIEAQANAGIEPDSISYIETHGTGTYLGDPIEVAALTKAFRLHTDKQQFCAIGSVKSNVGHLDAAAGVTGLIKTILALNHKQIPPSLHFEKGNPEIDFEHSPFYVNDTLSSWESKGSARRAGVSSLGIGGTNAHVIVEEAPPKATSSESRPCQLLLLSAQSVEALEQVTSRLVDHVKRHPDQPLPDVAYTLQVGRKAYDYRRMLVCKGSEDALMALDPHDSARVFTAAEKPKDRDIVFMFSGQGAQYVDMGLGLYQHESVFREQIDYCSEYLKPELGFDLRDVLFPAKGQVEEATERLRQTGITQPALFVTEYALARLWMSWGVKPHGMVGHSIGEYVAACLANVFTLDEGLSLVAARGNLMQECPGGSMLAVSLSEEEVQTCLGQKLSLALINGPSRCVLSGEPDAIDRLAEELSKKDIGCSRLHTSHAFHSPMMDAALNRFRKQVETVALNPPQVPFLSNTTGTWIRNDEATDPDYWVRHLRNTVRFADNLQELLKEPDRVLLELGPGHTLSVLARQATSTGQTIVCSSMRAPKEDTPDCAFILKSLGQLWLAGIEVDWSGFYSNEKRHRLPLPTYPFERTSHWFQPEEVGRPLFSSESATSRVMKLLQQGDSNGLIDLIQRSGQFTSEEAKALPKLIHALIDQNESPVSPVDDLLYEIVWQPIERSQGSPVEFIPSPRDIAKRLEPQIAELGAQPLAQSEEKIVQTDLPGGRWLILADDQGTGAQLAAKLISGGDECVVVHVGDAFEESASQVFKINPADTKDVQRLIETVSNQDTHLCGIVHLWSLDAKGADALTLDELRSAARVGCASALLLVQSLIESAPHTLPPLYLVTQGAQPAGQHPRLPGLAQSPLWGLGKVVGMEHPELPCVLVDLDSDNHAANVSSLVDALQLDLPEDQLAYRGSTCYSPRLARSSPRKISSGPPEPVRFSADNSFLIVGGLGGLGLMVAEWMVDRGARNVILAGRSPASEEASRQIGRLEEAGAKIVITTLDVSKNEDVANLLEELDRDGHNLRGIIHSALVMDDGVLLNQNPERFEKVMAPKVAGSWNLHTLTSERQLDFFMLFSSVTSFLGYPGQSSYLAANAFLEALAYYRRSHGLPGVVVNWGFMEGIGAAARLPKQERDRMERWGISPMDSNAGLEILERCFSPSVAQVGMVPVDWSIYGKQLTNRMPSLIADLVRHAGVVPVEETPLEEIADPLLRYQDAAPEDRPLALTSYVQSRIADSLGMSPTQLDVQQPLNYMGLDSLTAVGLRNRIKTDIGIAIPLAEFMGDSSVSRLVAFLSERETNGDGEWTEGEL